MLNYNCGKTIMYNDLFEDKYDFDHYDEDDLLLGLGPDNKYGFIAIKNPEYMQEKRDKDTGATYCDEREYIYRKPTAVERREIVINTKIERNGKPLSIPKLARLLAVSDRTLQSLLKSLQAEGLIEIIPRYGKNGSRISNAYKYIGQPCMFYGTGLNLHILHDPKQDVGFRNWAWIGQVFPHDKVWHDDVYRLCKIKFDARVARKKYLKERGLPLVVPEPIKFLVLRYSYWKGHNDVLCTILENGHFGTQFSKDGTIKIPLFAEKKNEQIKFFEYTLELRFLGSKDNPVIEIYDIADGEHLATFTWFDENIISRSIALNDEHTEQFFILGDFTTR